MSSAGEGYANCVLLTAFLIYGMSEVFTGVRQWSIQGWVNYAADEFSCLPLRCTGDDIDIDIV